MIIPLSVVAAAAALAVEPPQSDREAIQGTWVVVRTEINGKALPAKRLFTVKVTYDGDKLSATVGDHAPEPRGTFKLEQGKGPKRYDVTTPEGMKVLGLYELKGDTLTICFSSPGDERPDKMATEQEDGRTLVVYEREKPPADK